MDENMNRFLIGAVLASAIALAAGTAAAQAPAASKIGYVNTERVMRESRAAQQMQKGLEAEFRKRDKEIAAGPAADMERRRSLLIEDMNLRRENAVKQFIDKANGVIRRIAEAEKFDIVFLDAAYANARIEITEKVIKALDAGR
jgi:outer membrane protein